MVGGGEGAFIGAVHRAAAGLDQAMTLVCGAFASDAERSRRSGESLGLPPERCYADFNSMFAAEAKLPADARMEFVAIVTPNDLHLAVASAAFRHGFHVLSDKPATTSLAECLTLREALNASGCLYGLTHPYASYPLIVEAAERVRTGALGTVRKVLVEYTQGWLAEPIERRGQKQAIWRLDPKRAGLSSCMGDIGVHAFHLAEFVTGLRTTELCADLNSIVPGRELDDDGAAFLRFDNGARGVLVASQICTGEENDLRLRVYGDAASLDWRQQEPNSLLLKHAHKPSELIRSGGPGIGAATRANSRLPSGHPEGYLEAFANVYRAFAAQVRARRDNGGGPGAPAPATAVPGIKAALRGMAFIETVVAASKSTQKWHAFPSVTE
jgi:predicted dehydrogenase